MLLVSCPSDPRGYTAVLADLGFVILMDKVGSACVAVMDGMCRARGVGQVLGLRPVSSWAACVRAGWGARCEDHAW